MANAERVVEIVKRHVVVRCVDGEDEVLEGGLGDAEALEQVEFLEEAEDCEKVSDEARVKEPTSGELA